MSDYLKEFLNLKCAGDVLNVVSPLGRKPAKEITETMAVITRIRATIFENPNSYLLYDLCAGNALTSILAAHLLPVFASTAIDKRIRNRKWHNAKNFTYIFNDIHNVFDISSVHVNDILVSIHPCENARKIVDIWNNGAAKLLVLIPCCNGKINDEYKNPDKYKAWCQQMFDSIDGEKTIIEDRGILSPKNIVIVANR